MPTVDPNQTFGIELEFLCLRPAILPDVLFPADADPELQTIAYAVHKSLVYNGVLSSDPDPENIFTNDGEPSYTRWSVDSDVLVLSAAEEALLPAGWVAESVELSSRKMWYHQQDWKAEVSAVLKALRDVEAFGVRFITNASTGFHVHVGYGDRKVGLQTAKNVFQIATAMEHRIDELHASNRVAIPWQKVERHYCYPPSFFHFVRDFGIGVLEDVERVRTYEGLGVLDRLQDIERVRTYEGLGAFFDIPEDEIGFYDGMTGHNSAYNFDNLYPNQYHDRYEKDLKGTIEFRQHTGTLDFLTIIAWVETTVSLVQFAASAGIGEYVALLTSGLDNNFTLNHLLEALEVPRDTRAHYAADDDGEIIGVLPNNAEVSFNPVDALVALLEQNDVESTQATEKKTIADAIKQKYLESSYGHDQTQDTLPWDQARVVAAVQHESSVAAAMGIDVWSESGKSRIVEEVLAMMSKCF